MRKVIKLLMAFFFLAVLTVLSTQEALSVEILYPGDGTYFLRSDYLIIKAGDSAKVDSVSLTLNGEDQGVLDISAPEYREAFADMVILQPQFQRGRNTLRVDAYLQGIKIDSKEAEFFYLEGDSNLTPPPDYRPFKMHIPEKEAACAQCHNMNPDAAELGVSTAEENPCGSCHARMLNQAYVHGPAGVFQCAYCHELTSRPAKYAVVSGDAELCNGCHSNKSEAFASNKFVHGPVGVGLCGLCHDPHASPYPAQLRDKVNVVCVECHSTIKQGDHVGRGFNGDGHPLEGPRDPLRQTKIFTCASCHDPHGGNSGSLFILGVSERMLLCIKCHNK